MIGCNLELQRDKMKPETRNTFADRLNEALDDFGVPPKHSGRQGCVAKMFGVSQEGARKWLEGEGMPVIERAAKIAEHLKVNIEWLLTGRGQKKIMATPGGDLSELADEVIRWAGYDPAEITALIMHFKQNYPDLDKQIPRERYLRLILTAANGVKEGKLPRADWINQLVLLSIP